MQQIAKVIGLIGLLGNLLSTLQQLIGAPVRFDFLRQQLIVAIGFF